MPIRQLTSFTAHPSLTCHLISSSRLTCPICHLVTMFRFCHLFYLSPCSIYHLFFSSHLSTSFIFPVPSLAISLPLPFLSPVPFFISSSCSILVISFVVSSFHLLPSLNHSISYHLHHFCHLSISCQSILLTRSVMKKSISDVCLPLLSDHTFFISSFLKAPFFLGCMFICVSYFFSLLLALLSLQSSSCSSFSVPVSPSSLEQLLLQAFSFFSVLAPFPPSVCFPPMHPKGKKCSLCTYFYLFKIFWSSK